MQLMKLLRRQLFRRPICVVSGGFLKGAALFWRSLDPVPSLGMNERVLGDQMYWFQCESHCNLPEGGRIGRRGDIGKIGEEGRVEDFRAGAVCRRPAVGFAFLRTRFFWGAPKFLRRPLKLEEDFMNAPPNSTMVGREYWHLKIDSSRTEKGIQ